MIIFKFASVFLLPTDIMYVYLCIYILENPANNIKNNFTLQILNKVTIYALISRICAYAIALFTFEIQK